MSDQSIQTQRFRSGMITKKNYQQIANQIREMFDGKLFAIASCQYADSGNYRRPTEVLNG